jgi:hypothetical protein
LLVVVLCCFVTYFQAHRKRAGLRPWNKVKCFVTDDKHNILTKFNDMVEFRIKVPILVNPTEEEIQEEYTTKLTDSFNNDSIEIKYEMRIY